MNNLKALAAKQRDDILSSMVSDYLRIKFHEASGMSAGYSGKVNGAEISGNYTIAGTNNSPFATRGYVQPNGDDNRISITDQSLDPLCRLDTLAGGLLVLGRFRYATQYNDDTSSDYVFQYHEGATTRRWQVNIFSTGAATQIQAQLNLHNGTSLLTAAWQSGGSSKAANKDFCFALYFDMANKLLKCSGKSSSGSGTPGTTDIAAHTPYPGASAATKGASLFAHVSGSGPTFSSYFNNGTTTDDDGMVSDLWIVRKSDGFSDTKIAAILAEYYNRPTAIPTEFEGQ